MARLVDGGHAPARLLDRGRREFDKLATYLTTPRSDTGQTRVFNVELRGLEPRTNPAKIGSELGWMFDHGVTRPLCVLPICAAVLRDVTVLWPVLQPVHPTGRAPWQLP